MPSAHLAGRRPRKAPTPTPTTTEGGWSLRRVAGLEILTAKKLELLPWVVHGFSTRKGGASRLDGIAALNLGFTQWDSRASVARNRRAFTGAIRATDASARLDERVARPESLVRSEERRVGKELGS